jgi:diadenosine tetraphosphate (Ap4A) HIT family hydrolase
MKYLDVLKNLWKDFDPFIHIKKSEIIDESESFFVIAARAPYVQNHLLIIPKRKIYILKDLKNKEQEEMRELIELRTLKLHKLHNSVNLLLRDWLVWEKSWKSVNHLHFHLIPDCPIWAENLDFQDREWFDDAKYIKVTTEIRRYFLD